MTRNHAIWQWDNPPGSQANVTALIYDQGLRSAWYQLEPNMHINAEQADQVNNFETAGIVTRGEFLGKLNGVERVFREGETVLIQRAWPMNFTQLVTNMVNLLF